MQRTGQIEERNLSSTERVHSNLGTKAFQGWADLLWGPGRVHTTAIDLSTFPAWTASFSKRSCPGQDCDDSKVGPGSCIFLIPSYISGASSMFTMHICFIDGLRRVQTVAKGQGAGQVGYACVLRVAESCGNMVFIQGSFSTQPK